MGELWLKMCKNLGVHFGGIRKNNNSLKRF